MTTEEQRQAFDNELHKLVIRFFDEFDLPAEDLLEILVREEMFIIHMAVEKTMEEEDWGDDLEDWQKA